MDYNLLSTFGFICSPAHSFILDLSPSSAIKSKFSTEQWTKLTTEKHHAVKIYHTEIDSIITQLFGQDQNVRVYYVVFGYGIVLVYVNISLTYFCYFR